MPDTQSIHPSTSSTPLRVQQEIMDLEAKINLEIINNLMNCGMFEISMQKLRNNTTGGFETDRKTINKKLKNSTERLVRSRVQDIHRSTQALSNTSDEFLKVASTAFCGGGGD